MRIDRLIMRNFKGFGERELTFHPEFNLVVGDNGTGKTSVLDALSVAAASWFLGLRGYDTRHIRSDDVRLVRRGEGEEASWERQWPCAVEAYGEVSGQPVRWTRQLNSERGRTTYADARDVKDLASEADELVRTGERPVTLPLISYYSTGRLWNVPSAEARVGVEKIRGKAALSRLEAYRYSVDPRLSVSDLVEWVARESWRAFQQDGQYSSTFLVAREAMLRSVKDATSLRFDAEYGEVVLGFASGEAQPFNNLSDGQRNMLALVGDLARKAATLNPHLREDVLRRTPGLVLIDELDLHLHPTWQRTVIEDLRAAFPAVQFICTTHSPFLIQSLRSGEELVMLDGQPPASLGDLPLEAIARGVQRVPEPDVSERYATQRATASEYLRLLDEAGAAPDDRKPEVRRRLAETLAPHAGNAAFQAFLDMERAAKLGE